MTTNTSSRTSSFREKVTTGTNTMVEKVTTGTNTMVEKVKSQTKKLPSTQKINTESIRDIPNSIRNISVSRNLQAERLILLITTIIAFILSSTSVSSCHFLHTPTNNNYYGAFSYQHNTSQTCHYYPIQTTFSSADRAGRVFAVLAPLFGAIGIVSFLLALLLVKRMDRRRMLLGLMTACWGVAFGSQMLTFVVLGGEMCSEISNEGGGDCQLGGAGMASVWAVVFWLVGALVSVKVEVPDKPLVTIENSVARWMSLGTSLSAVLLSIAATASCDFIKIHEAASTSSNNNSSDDITVILRGIFSSHWDEGNRCVSYSRYRSFDSAENTARTAGTIAPLAGSIGIVSLALLILFIQDMRFKPYAWRCTMVCFSIATFFQLLTFALLECEECKSSNVNTILCLLGPAGVSSVFSCVFWALSMIIVGIVPIPDRHLMLCCQWASTTTTTTKDSRKINTKMKAPVDDTFKRNPYSTSSSSIDIKENSRAVIDDYDCCCDVESSPPFEKLHAHNGRDELDGQSLSSYIGDITCSDFSLDEVESQTVGSIYRIKESIDDDDVEDTETTSMDTPPSNNSSSASSSPERVTTTTTTTTMTTAAAEETAVEEEVFETTTEIETKEEEEEAAAAATMTVEEAMNGVLQPSASTDDDNDEKETTTTKTTGATTSVTIDAFEINKKPDNSLTTTNSPSSDSGLASLVEV